MALNYDKRVLITGGCGFIGSNFLNYFIENYSNYYFLIIDKLNYASNLSNLERLKKFPNFKFLKLDIGDSELFNIVESFQIDEIINFAAESSVDKSFKDPLYFTSNNILQVQNLLEVYKQSTRIKFMIHISTDEVYGDDMGIKDETTILNPTNPYSATKASMDLIINAYKYSYNLPIVIIRPNNVFGPLQYPEKIIPMIIEKLKNNESIPIHGNGLNKRRYLYIDDLLSAIDLLWHMDRKSTNGEIYNVGNEIDSPIDNNSLVELIGEIFNKKPNIEYVKDRNYNDLDYSISSKKINDLGWNRKVSLKQGLTKIINEIEK